MPLGPDLVPFFESLWYVYATLVPLAPGQEEVLLPLTRYLRERGQAVTASELFFAQGYLQFATRAAATLNASDAILTPGRGGPPPPLVKVQPTRGRGLPAAPRASRRPRSAPGR